MSSFHEFLSTYPRLVARLTLGGALALFGLYMFFFGPRLVSHLIRKYLMRRYIAWVSLVAVTLCTAMVIVVISVMGGWLRMFRDQFHGLSGDIVISRQSLAGFPHYQEIIDEVEKIPEVKAAVPSLRTYGLINILNQVRDGVQVIGYPIERIGDVNNFDESLWRQHQKLIEEADDPKTPLTPHQREELRKQAAQTPSWKLPLVPDAYTSVAPNSKSDVTKWPGMIVGVGVIGIERNPDGTSSGREMEYQAWAKLTVLGVADRDVNFDFQNKSERPYWIIDDSRTQIWQFDQNTVYVPFEILQKDLGMDPQQAEDTATHQKIVIPARTNDIQVGLKPGFDMYAVKPKVLEAVDRIAQKYEGLAEAARAKNPKDPNAMVLSDAARALGSIRVQTWEEMQKKFLDAVEKEKVLVTFLFSLISVVAIFLVFCIFYMIVVEKTKDIGIIKSVGATGGGVAGIFLGYGLAIGVVGGGLGLAAGWAIVHWINPLHEQMGKLMGIKIWDPSTYQFDTIPNTVNWFEVSIIVGVAIVSAVLGALIPALVAARMNPIEALRWE